MEENGVKMLLFGVSLVLSFVLFVFLSYERHIHGQGWADFRPRSAQVPVDVLSDKTRDQHLQIRGSTVPFACGGGDFDRRPLDPIRD